MIASDETATEENMKKTLARMLCSFLILGALSPIRVAALEEPEETGDPVTQETVDSIKQEIEQPDCQYSLFISTRHDVVFNNNYLFKRIIDVR